MFGKFKKFNTNHRIDNDPVVEPEDVLGGFLTSDIILNKRFKEVKYRDGYDQEEVDEFMDDVVASFYALEQKVKELEGKLADIEGTEGSDNN